MPGLRRASEPSAEFRGRTSPEPEAVWKETRKRLDNWLEGFLRSEAAQSRSSEGGEPLRGISAWESIWNFFTPRRIVWGLGVAGALVLMVAAPLLLEYRRAQLLQVQVTARPPVSGVSPLSPAPEATAPEKSTEMPKRMPHEQGLPKAGGNLPSGAESTIRPKAGEPMVSPQRQPLPRVPPRTKIRPARWPRLHHHRPRTRPYLLLPRTTISPLRLHRPRRHRPPNPPQK